MEITLLQLRRFQVVGGALLGCALIAICASLKIPFYPVPFTMQTFALFVLALTQSPRQVLLSTLTYLFCATLGMPVLAGLSDPLWFTGKSAGYLFAFPIGAWLCAKVAEKRSPYLAVALGQVVIFLFGFSWLIPFVGVKIAWTHGVLVFIGPSIVKCAAAVYLSSKWRDR